MNIRVFRTVKDSPAPPFGFQDLVKIREELLASPIPEPTLLIAELPPTIVYSRKQTLPPSPPPQAFTITQDTRGGFETYHGPGQWTGYLLLPRNCIAPSGKEARAVADFLLLRLKSALNPLLPSPKIVCQDGAELGLWVEAKKLVSCAFELRRTGTLLGFAVNVYPTKESFSGVRPCGLDVSPAYLYPKPAGDCEPLMQDTLNVLSRAFL